MLTAITRGVSPELGECELSFLDRESIDIPRAMAQHAAYQAALGELGVSVVGLPTLPGHPDCVFVEDPMVVLDEIAVVTRMGAESRRGESPSLAAAVAGYRELRTIEAPATLEGGDVMRVEKTLYVGLSRRTNIAGIQQLAKLVEPFGYWVTPVEIRDCLHLKSACSYLGDNTVLANRAWIDLDAFCGVRFIDVVEAHAANALRIGDTVVLPSSYPETIALLESRGFHIRAIDVSELIKAEAGVTCISLVFSSPAPVSTSTASRANR